METEITYLLLPFFVMSQQMLTVNWVGNFGGVGLLALLICNFLETIFLHQCQRYFNRLFDGFILRSLSFHLLCKFPVMRGRQSAFRIHPLQFTQKLEGFQAVIACKVLSGGIEVEGIHIIQSCNSFSYLQLAAFPWCISDHCSLVRFYCWTG